jgi:hypothetical protein
LTHVITETLKLNLESSLLLLKPHLANIASPSANAALSSAVSTALTSCLSASSNAVPPGTAVAFLQSLALALPSSSSGASPDLSVLGELIVDAAWVIDAGFEEASDKISDNKDSNTPQIEKDRAILVDVLKQLLVSNILSALLSPISFLPSDTTSSQLNFVENDLNSLCCLHSDWWTTRSFWNARK